MNFSILDWNIQGTKYYTSTKLSKVLPVFETVKADIICIQEGQEIVSTIKSISTLESFNLISSDKNRHGTNVILSKFPIISNGKLGLPLSSPYALDNIIWASLEIGGQVLKIYNCHLEIIGVGSQERADKLRYILMDAKNHPGPVIVCGDFNTTIPEKGIRRKIVQLFHHQSNNSLVSNPLYSHQDERYHFIDVAKEEGFFESLDISQSTWCVSCFGFKIFNFKLDWLLVRGLKLLDVELGEYISDHKSIFAKYLI